jgi:hypothetical protein
MTKLETAIFVKLCGHPHQNYIQGVYAMPNALSVGGPNSKYGLERAKPAGFLAGLWRGLVAPIAFVISLFSPKVKF